jgi:class 3 adenylate cyclase
VAIVLNDLTEKNKLMAQRRLFERMVSPAVIQQLDPDSLPRVGRRQWITVLFADIRGFTGFTEGQDPERLVEVLNQHLAAAAEAVLAEEGTIDKFLGDAVMAWFNAPILQADHPMRAVRAAVRIRAAIRDLHTTLPAPFHLSFGIGIHCGEAVLGLVGTQARLDFTAIGDCVNTAQRLQEAAAGGQILISDEVRGELDGSIQVRAAGTRRVRGKRAALRIYEVVEG